MKPKRKTARTQRAATTQTNAAKVLQDAKGGKR